MGEATDYPAPPRRLSRLQRLRAALAARDWLGILIELAVVTVGVLLAFQVDQFGDSRERAREERQFQERLYREYRRGVDELSGVNRVHDKAIGDIRLAMAARGNPAQLQRYAGEDNFGCYTTRPPTAPFSDSAYQDLLASGRLNLVSDLKLRDDIRDLATAQAEARTQWEIARSIATVQLATLDPFFHFTIDRAGRTRCTVDWPQLVQDPAAVDITIRAYRIHDRVRAARMQVLNQMMTLRRELACKLGKPECRAATSPPS